MLLVFSSPSHAAGEFSVDNVVVNATGSDATDARAKAMSQGEQEAFRQLATRMNPTHAADIISKTKAAQISALVHSFEVADEKMSPGHYQATLRYSFSPAPTQVVLGLTPAAASPAGAPSPSATTAAPTPSATGTPPAPSDDHVHKAVLVLPVWHETDSLKLWEDNNRWRSLWFESALEAGGGLVIAPLGDLDDRVDVDSSNVDNATGASLSRMYGRYGVGEIYELSAFYNLKADPKPTLEVTLRRITPQKTETSRMNYTIRSTETLDTLMVRAANDIAHHLYMLQTIDPNKIEYDRLKDITARVNTTDIREWESLRRHLLTHGNIVSVKLTSISYYETIMTITYKGTSDMLGKTLVASGLRVMLDGDSLVLALP